jgi:hypothetical protein
MTVTIDIPAEIEATLRRRAEAAGKDVGAIVKEFVVECLAEESQAPVKTASHREFMAKLHAVIALHPKSDGSMDDSRESIYAGRGE